MNTLLHWFGGLLIVALAAMFAVPMLVDWNSYRSTFEQEFGRVLGREVRVGGNVALRLLPVPYVSLEKVRIADVTGRFDTPFVKVESVSIWLSMIPLSYGDVEVRDIEFKKPELRLAVDADGRGNWRGLGKAGKSTVFLSGKVAVNSAQVVDGLVHGFDASGRELFALAGLTGEVAADSLAGPFRYRGAFDFAGERREARVTTGVVEGNDQLALTAFVTLARTKSEYNFDGKLIGFSGVPKLDGKLAAVLPLAGGARRDDVFRVQSAVTGDISGLKFAGLTIVREQKNRQQKFEGNAALTFGDRPAVDANLSGRFLDADEMITGRASKEVTPSPEAASDAAPADPALPGTDPAAVLEASANGLLDWLPESIDAHIKSTLEQVAFGGEVLNGIRLDVARKAGKLTINQLAARAPGASEVLLNGSLDRMGGSPALSGHVRLAGRNLVRFAKWAWPGRAIFTDGEGAFLLDGDINLSSAAVELKSARAEIAGASVRGGLLFKPGDASGTGVAEEKRASLDLTLESRRLDLSRIAVLDEVGGLLASILADATGLTLANSEGSLGAAAAFANARISARIGDLVTSRGTFHDVVARIDQSADHIKIGDVRFETDAGLLLKFSGEVAGPPDARKGQIGIEAEVKSAAAMAELSLLAGEGALAGGGAPLPVDFASRPGLVPAFLTGVIDIGLHAPNDIDIALDGMLAGNASRITSRISGHGLKLASRPIELTASFSNGEPAALLGLLLGEARAKAVLAESGGRENAKLATAELKFSGVPEKSLSGAASFESDFLTAGYVGSISGIFEPAGTLAGEHYTLAGRLKLKAAHPNVLVALSGLPDSWRLPDSPATIDGDLARDGRSFRLSALDAWVGKSHYTGDFSFSDQAGSDQAGSEQTGGKASLAMIGELNSGDFASLAGGLLRDPGAAAGVEQAAGLTRDWSSDPLSAQRLSGLSGRVDLKVGTLSLVDGLIASNAHIVANLSPGLAVLDSLDAELLGGRLAGKGSASAASSGVGISFDGDLTGVALQQLGAEDGAGRIAAKADFKIAARSEGADAGTLAASLAGNAEIRVSAGEISALSPHAVAETARAVLAKEAGNDPASIAAAFDKLRAVSGFGFEAAVIPVKIDHGQIRLDPVTLKGGDADLLVDGSLDLSKWAGGGVFQLSPHKVPGEQTSLPAVSLAYSGPLATLFDAAPEIDVGALLLELIRRSEQAAAVPSDAIPLIGIAPKPAVGAAANPASGFVGPKAAPLVADPGIAGPAGAAPAGDGNLSSDAVSVDASDAADATAAAAPAGNAAAKLLGGDTAKTPAVIKPKKIKRRPAQKPASIFSDLPFDIFGNSQKLGGPVVKPPKKPLTTVIKPFFVPSNNR